MNRTDEQAARAVNETFYRAIERADIDAMDALWLHTDWVKCVHPGEHVIIGWEAVRESWRQIFERTGYQRIQISDVSFLLADDFACVSCAAEMVLLGSQSSPLITNATNLFQRVNGVWRMLHHHASRVTTIRTFNDKDEGITDGT